jgi:nicotinamidase-related amidase
MPSALLVIDVQVGLFRHATPVFAADLLLGRICNLTERASLAGAPVVYIQHANKNQLSEGSLEWQLHPSLNPAPEDIRITKRHGSALKETPLKAELEKRGIDTLVISGLVTHGCVRATCEDALRQGYRVVLVSDAHSSYNADAPKLIAEWNQKLARDGAELRSTAEIEFA